MSSFLTGLTDVGKGVASGFGKAKGLEGMFSPLNETPIKNPATGKMEVGSAPLNKWQETGQALGKMLGEGRGVKVTSSQVTPTELAELPELRKGYTSSKRSYQPPSIEELLSELVRR